MTAQVKQTEERDRGMKLLDALDAIIGHVHDGISNAQLAKKLDVSPATISRCMDTIITKGWARRDIQTGRYHPTADYSRLAFRVVAAFDAAEQRLADMKRSFTRTN